MSEKIDWGQISGLCGVITAMVGVGPGYGNIVSEAMAELRNIDERIRKSKLEAQGLEVTPAPVGDPESPAQAIPSGGSEGDFDRHPLASEPLQSLDGPEAPEVTLPAPTSKAVIDAQGEDPADKPDDPTPEVGLAGETEDYPDTGRRRI